MNDIFIRLWNNLLGRITGPMSFRLIMQPLTSVRVVRPFLWTVVTDPTQRSVLLRGAWKDVGKVFIFAVILDAIYQLIQLRAVHLLELLIVAPTLAFVPYVLLRGPVTRLVGAFTRRTSA